MYLLEERGADLGGDEGDLGEGVRGKGVLVVELRVDMFHIQC